MNEETKNLLAQARIQSDFGRKGEAMTLLQRALVLAPDSGDLLCQLAVAHQQGGQWDKMLGYAEKAAAVSPENEWPHRIRSIALCVLDRHEEGMAAAYEAARIAPTSILVLTNLADTLRMCSNYKEAEAVGLRLAQAAPHDVKTHRVLANIYLSTSRWSSVERHVRIGLQIDAENVILRRQLGRALAAQGRNMEAVQAYASALQLDPVDEDTRTEFQTQCLASGISSLPSKAACFILLFAALLTQLSPLRGGNALATGAMLASALLTMLLLVMRFRPALLLGFQRGYRRLPGVTQRLVAQQCRTHWALFIFCIITSIVTSMLALGLSLMRARFYAH